MLILATLCLCTLALLVSPDRKYEESDFLFVLGGELIIGGDGVLSLKEDLLGGLGGVVIILLLS